jgi:Flp pilus assembly protein TadG
MRQPGDRQGNATLEFVLVGLPLIFVLMSVASICFGMYTFHTMEEAVEQAARYVITHGSTCSTNGNSCAITVGTIAKTIASAAPGVINGSLDVTLIPNSGAGSETTCNPVTSCFSNSTAWPPSANSNNVPGNDIVITADFSYPSPIAMFWPGAGSSHFGTMYFHAASRQRLMF